MPVVLLHGLASRAECWIDIVPLFPPDTYTLYLLDLLGSGESSKPKEADYSIRAHSERLLRFLEKASLSRVLLVGHSLGGAIGLVAAIEAMQTGRKRLLAALVNMAGPGYIQRLPVIAEVFQRPLAGTLFVLLYAPDAWIKIGLRAAYHDHSLVDRKHIARYAPCYRDRKAKRALVETCRSLVPADRDAIAARYGELKLPVLLLWGRYDQIVPLSQGERLNAAIPGSRLEIIEDCGHNPQEEKPEETFRIIDRFAREKLASNLPGPTSPLPEGEG
ncbi:alpha/beta hydrolase [Geomonas sp.]|uniref:alpha/beta fold hydrolase n=1 Tax=Geomonas sp. TaxID=2651584 RepID=UPI002B485094|nr:alpha/beta hydrolase [Geomonas sp.]HJV35419.1 alpha/beta hydrolase [Geomonas sp.]